jgi:DNA-binding NarL/FixJ family response regulator
MERVIGGKSHLRLLLADDHVIFSDALRVYLEKNFDIVGVVSNGRTLVDEAIRIKPDVIIVDVGMPLLNGLDAARRIKELARKIKFVFLTMQDDPNLAAAALELGPVAFVLKHSAGPELLEAINEVMHGHSYLTPKLRATDWVEAKARARQFSKDLTPRQRDIVQLLAEGRPMKEIAGFLQLSEKTVEFHKHHIMVAFNLKNNPDLVLFALNQGLIAADRTPPFLRPS